MIFGLLLSLVLGNNYQEVDGGTVYIQSHVTIVNDKLTDRIISVREGRKPLTYEILWVENDQIVLMFNN